MASIVWIPVIFCLSTSVLYLLSVNSPTLQVKNNENHENVTLAIKFPTTMNELHSLAAVMKQYRDEHFFYVLLLFATAYLYKQTFAIPGSVFMNLLAGAVFGVYIGLPLACILTATGATNCYFLSKYFGKSYIMKYFPERLSSMQKKVEENIDSLFFFLLFLRLFPISPNWFMNMVAPILNIPVHLFFCSVLVGLIPYNFICIQTGCILSQINSTDEIFTFYTLLKLFGMALVALIPGIMMNKRKITIKFD